MSTKGLILLVLLRISIGLFWTDHGVAKINSGWLTAEKLKPRLVAKSLGASGIRKFYFQKIALPASPLLRYLVALGETAIGLSLLAGFLMKPAAWSAVLLVINIKYAWGELNPLDIIGSASFLPLLIGTLLVAYAGTSDSWTIKRVVPQLKQYDL